jgi:hypothetical protein
MTRSTAARIADVTRIIGGRPAVALSALPALWQNTKADYADAACLFAWHGTPLATEALTAIGTSLTTTDGWPNLTKALAAAKSDLSRRAVLAVMDIEAELGRDVPAALYEVLLATALRDEPEALMDMFKNRDTLMQDRLWDAVLHAALLVTPVGLFIQSCFAKRGVLFTHVMNCGCGIQPYTGTPFDLPLDADLKAAYLQNMVAAALEQYGVNAATSRAGRGF